MSHPQVIVKNYYQAPENLGELLTEIVTRLITVETQLDANNKQGEQIMTQAENINARLDTIYTSTNEIAADIDKLLENGLTGLTKDEADAVEARLADLATALKTVAAKS